MPSTNCKPHGSGQPRSGPNPSRAGAGNETASTALLKKRYVASRPISINAVRRRDGRRADGHFCKWAAFVPSPRQRRPCEKRWGSVMPRGRRSRRTRATLSAPSWPTCKAWRSTSPRSAMIKILHRVTGDSPDGQPWPPPDSNTLWAVVRRADGCTLWRAIQLAEVRSAAPDSAVPRGSNRNERIPTMTKIICTSKYLKAADLKGKPHIVTIECARTI